MAGRSAGLAAAVLFVGTLGVASGPAAASTCAAPTWLTNMQPIADFGASDVTSGSAATWWRTNLYPGTYRFSVTPIVGQVTLSVRTGSDACTSSEWCGVTSSLGQPATCQGFFGAGQAWIEVTPAAVGVSVPYTVSIVHIGPPSSTGVLQCTDGLDNDYDGQIDSADSDCTGPTDMNEYAIADGCDFIGYGTVCAYVTPTNVRASYPVVAPGMANQTIAGYVDTYRFALPNGGSIVVPCAVVGVGTTTADPCASAGGTFVSRLYNLSQPVTAPTGPLTTVASVGVCDADLVLTWNDIGIESFPIVTVC